MGVAAEIWDTSSSHFQKFPGLKKWFVVEVLLATDRDVLGGSHEKSPNREQSLQIFADVKKVLVG